jgi:hypothetical protein
MNTAQEVGFGALIGGAATVLTNLGLRYFADDAMTQPTTVGEQPARPFLYEHAPLLGLVPGAVATFAAYKWMGGAPAAVACAITSLFAATAPPIDDWVQDARAEKDAKEAQEPGAGEGVDRYGGYPQRLAALGRKVGRAA